MKNYDERMVLNSRLVIKIETDQIRKNFVKSMSVKKFSYLGQFILGLRRSGIFSGKLADNHYLCGWSIHAFDIRRPTLHVHEAANGNPRGLNPLECNFRRF